MTFERSISLADVIDLFCKKENAMCFCWNASMEVRQIINDPGLDLEVFPMAFPTNGGCAGVRQG